MKTIPVIKSSDLRRALPLRESFCRLNFALKALAIASSGLPSKTHPAAHPLNYFAEQRQSV